MGRERGRVGEGKSSSPQCSLAVDATALSMMLCGMIPLCSALPYGRFSSLLTTSRTVLSGHL